MSETENENAGRGVGDAEKHPTGQPNWDILAQVLGLEHLHKASVGGDSASPNCLLSSMIVCI